MFVFITGKDTTTMYCVNCGAQYEEGVNFCRHCGQTFEEKPALPAADQSEVLRILQALTGANLSQDRVSAILRQVLGLLALVAALFAVVQKPNPGIFILYAIPPLLGGVVVALERKASVGKAMFLLLMFLPYSTLFLLGVPPIMVSGVQDVAKAAAGLGGFFSAVALAMAFLAAGFLFMIFSSIVSLIFTKQALIAGGVSLALTVVMTIVFMSMLGNPAVAATQSLTVADRLDSNISLVTTALAPDNDGKITETQRFMSNEMIFAYTQGLSSGTRFGYRVSDTTGKVVIPFDRLNAAQAKGTGLDKYDAINTVDLRLAPGNYVLDLMVSQGWKTTVAARTMITVLSEVNPNYGVQTTDPYAWLAGSSGVAATAFKKDDPVAIVLDGSRLQNGVNIIIKGGDNKVVLEKDYSAMPLGKSQYSLADKASTLGSGHFVASITSQGKEPIIIYFTIE
jgi:hypothetical protein